MSVELHPAGGVTIDGNHLPDDFAIEGFGKGWNCVCCESQWMRYRLKADGTSRIRLLHNDGDCPCFGRHCECGEATS